LADVDIVLSCLRLAGFDIAISFFADGNIILSCLQLASFDIAISFWLT
jgi:hypothetical protein